jgi:hypothetical protein
MPGYLQMIDEVASMREGHPTWGAISPEYVVRMKLQNRFRTGATWLPTMRIRPATHNLWGRGTASSHNRR